MDPDRDPFIESLRRELRKDPVGRDVDSRIMGAVRRTGMARWPRLFMPRRLFVTPLPWSLGATIALLFAGLIGAKVALQKTAARPINRFGVMYVPNGMIMKNYLPVVEGSAFELTPTLSALAPFRDRMLVLSGLNSTPTPGRPGGAHAKASTRFLTDVSPPTSETWLDAGISMDQILAGETGKHTQLASRSSSR